jgi:glucosamine--fructose-6-phosphate aminotransferase (isomerizing)
MTRTEIALDNATYREIFNQPTAWRATIDRAAGAMESLQQVWQADSLQPIVVTGCGSPYYLAQSLAIVLRQLTGVAAVAVPASNIWLFPELHLPSNASLLICISRSGETTETIRAAQTFRQHTGGEVLTITCYPDTPLAAVSSATLVLSEAQEISLTQTQSFTSMLIAAQQIAYAFIDHNTSGIQSLPDVCEQLLNDTHDRVRGLGSDLGYERFFFLGDAALYGIASEAMLKMKEMTLSYSEAYHTLEFRHGPMAMVNDRTLLVGLVSEEARDQQAKVLSEMQDMGADVLAITSQALPDSAVTYQIVLDTDLETHQHLVLYLPPLQLLACYRAVAKGLNPDTPSNLNAFVRLDIDPESP